MGATVLAMDDGAIKRDLYLDTAQWEAIAEEQF